MKRVPRILNIGFSATTTPTVATLFIPITMRLLAVNFVGYFDGTDASGAAYVYASQNQSAPSFSAFPSGIIQSGILAHLRQGNINAAAGSTLRVGFNEMVPIPGIEIEAGASLYVHASTAVGGNVLGVVLFHILEG